MIKITYATGLIVMIRLFYITLLSSVIMLLSPSTNNGLLVMFCPLSVVLRSAPPSPPLASRSLGVKNFLSKFSPESKYYSTSSAINLNSIRLGQWETPNLPYTSSSRANLMRPATSNSPGYDVNTVATRSLNKQIE